MSIKEAIETLCNSKAFVVVFTNEDTVMELFEELNQTDGAHKFLWIASDEWVSTASVYETSPEIARGMLGFQLHVEYIAEFDYYFFQLHNSCYTSKRNPFFQDYYEYFCNGTDCLNGLTKTLTTHKVLSYLLSPLVAVMSWLLVIMTP